jgi:HSP20 family protein
MYMATLLNYDPFQEMLSLRDAMNRLFEQSFVSPWWRGQMTTTQGWIAPVNVYETEQGYHVYLMLPGLQPENIDLTVQQNSLTIKGQYQPLFDTGKEGKWLVQEFGPGSFERTLTFAKPIDVENIQTQYEHGILSLFVPVSEAVRPKRISITGSHTVNSQLSSGEQKVLTGAGSH